MNGKNLLVGAGVGVALIYLFDPVRGRRRRALARDRIVRATRKTRDALDVTVRDIANRTKGIAASARGRFASDKVDDAILIERVRAKLGRVCTHPRAIDVEAADGDVTLRGPILASEMNDLLSVAAAIRGVRSVSNELEPYDSAEGVPSLQGEGNLPDQRFDILQRNWAPGTQALVAAAGLAATGICFAAYARR